MVKEKVQRIWEIIDYFSTRSDRDKADLINTGSKKTHLNTLQVKTLCKEYYERKHLKVN